MELTIDYIRKKFKQYNSLYWNNKLIEPIFAISNSKRSLGTFSYNHCNHTKITISKYYNRNEFQYDNTIIHEMIHLYIHQMGIRDSGHGKYFKSECARINRDGWDLARTTDTRNWCVAQENIDKMKKQNINFHIFVYQYNGQQYIFRSAKSAVDSFKLHFKRYSIEYRYYYTNDKIFEKAPRCVKQFRGYTIDANPEFSKYKIKVEILR